MDEALEQSVIVAVKKRRILYDSKYPGFQKRNLRDLAWNEISEEVGRDARVCKGIWTTLRCAYNKKLSTQKARVKMGDPEAHKGPNRVFFQELSFLKEHVIDGCTDTINDPGEAFSPTPTEQDIILADWYCFPNIVSHSSTSSANQSEAGSMSRQDATCMDVPIQGVDVKLEMTVECQESEEQDQNDIDSEADLHHSPEMDDQQHHFDETEVEVHHQPSEKKNECHHHHHHHTDTEDEPHRNSHHHHHHHHHRHPHHTDRKDENQQNLNHHHHHTGMQDEHHHIFQTKVKPQQHNSKETVPAQSTAKNTEKAGKKGGQTD